MPTGAFWTPRRLAATFALVLGAGYLAASAAGALASAGVLCG